MDKEKIRRLYEALEEIRDMLSAISGDSRRIEISRIIGTCTGMLDYHIVQLRYELTDEQ